MEQLYLPDSGSKVNGLGQPIHPWWVHCHLVNIPDGLGSDRKDREWRQNRGQPPLVQELGNCRKVVCEKDVRWWTWV